ncbi:hypothetical protein UB48_26905 [Pseudomonas sp. 2(2015)]|nr:hypothetical protein UB48_26905 [Pseudomonas sp. 2(2015)]
MNAACGCIAADGTRACDVMWARLILPDCRACDVRKAASWKTRLCVICTAEVLLLEEALALNLDDENPTCM